MMILSGCNSIIVKKRRYFKGYYVHFPLGRNSSPLKNKRAVIPHRDSLAVKTDTARFDSLAMVPLNDTAHKTNSTAFVTSAFNAIGGVTDTINIRSGNDTITFVGFPHGTAQPGGSPMFFNGSGHFPFDTIRLAGNPPGNGQPGYPPNTPFVPGAFTPDSILYETPVDSIALHAEDDTCMLFVTEVPHYRKSREFVTEFFMYTGVNGFQVNRTYAVNPYSFNSGMELRLKTKLAAKTELTGAFGLGISSISINQRNNKPAPLTSAEHSRERITHGGLRASLGMRYHLPDRKKENGDVIKMEVDAEARGEADFYTANIFTDHFTDAGNAAGKNFRVKTRITDLPYMNKLNCGVTARLTRNNCSVFANYRISSLIRNPFGEADLPKLTIGVGLVLR
jgi:hypothetical protein